MNSNGDDKKLDWMYKGANSLVDREEYLLGRSVDKTLEQLNAEEKEKKLGLVPPKNHVEHECIPPSIRDFNKIVQAEQVDISAKLQEDPLVAIKKREEEARRQFLQNPVQLKKLQEALKAQQLKKKKKHRKSKTDSDSDLDNKIVKKLKYLKEDPSSLAPSKKQKKKSEDNILDTILMHKFNQLKDRLSQDDLNEILAGDVSDSDEEKKEKKHKKRKNFSIEESDSEEVESKKKKKRKSRSTSKEKPKKTKKRNSSSDSSSSEEEKHVKYKKEGIKRYRSSSNRELSEEKYRDIKHKVENNRRKQSASRYEIRDKYDKDHRNGSRSVQEKERRKERKDSSSENDRNKIEGRKEQGKEKNDDSDSDLESRILKKLRMLRDSADKLKRKENNSDNDDDKKKRSKKAQKKRKTTSSSSESSSDSNSEDQHSQNKHKSNYGSDSDEQVRKPKAFGLVKSDGTKLSLGKKPYEVKKPNKTSVPVEAAVKPDRRNVKKLSEEEKEKLRREMMKNAEKRDIERSENLKRYRAEDKKEEKDSANYDKDFLRKQLLKSTKDATVETRIKSNLNNIQRSSRHMDSHFSRK